MIELPTIATPKPVARAAQVVRDREGDVTTAKEAIEAAKATIAQAVVQDRERYASALDAGRDDPGREAEEAAREALDETERRLSVEEVRLTRAREALDAALGETIGGWVTSLEQATTKAEAEALAALDGFAAAEQQRARVRHALAWAQNYARDEKLPSLSTVPLTRTALVRNPQASPYETYPVAELVDVLRAVLARVTLAAETARSAERADDPQPLRIAG